MMKGGKENGRDALSTANPKRNKQIPELPFSSTWGKEGGSRSRFERRMGTPRF